ncbi:MAG: alpha/beta hydrolase [Acidobacteria bacterium]|nr:alpha/beta hydrolase [Acidobacteriota bacterium]
MDEAWVTVGDGRIRYRLSGDGPPAVLTPGGRLGMDDLAAMAAALRPHFRLLEWDRRNTGQSDLWFGEGSEQRRWADDLAALLDHVKLAPAWLLGGSAGSRVSYITAARHPVQVRGLVVWSVSGGPYASQNLGHDYHRPFIDAAIRGGMAGVAATPFFAARLAVNPDAESHLLATEPELFIAAMRRWNEDFFAQPGASLPSASDAELRSIRCPTLIFEGNDDFHPAAAAEALHRLVPGAVLAPLPWTGEEFMFRQLGRVEGTIFDLYPQLLPAILEYVDAVEGARAGR